jgi:methyl-accepting chemotaxis protein
MNTNALARHIPATTPGNVTAKPAAASSHGMSLVNMSARQRMLSQRLTLQIVLAAQGHSSQLSAAEQSLALFVESQAQLVQTARNLSNGDGQVLRAAYFEPGNVARTVDTFILHAQEALQHARSGNSSGSALERLVGGIDGVLQALNAATSAFDQISTAKEAAIMRELRSIVGDIQSVAREAKVVSFNAQVIAARAGTVGREFAVVANTLAGISTEVDTLAKKGLALAGR